MKKLVISLLFLLFITTNIFGQNVNNHIILEPKQKKDPIKIETSCLVLLRDYPMIISIPLGKSYDILLPKGTKYLIEKGNYPLGNPMAAILEFELVSADICQK